MNKVLVAVVAAMVVVCAASAPVSAQAAEPKVLRYAFPSAETGFDPVQVSDTYSNSIITGIFDAPLRYSYLARPYRLEPSGCELPLISADFRTITLKVRPGIFFSDDPAFKGPKRELVAADYVYALKRHYDPKFSSPNLYRFETVGVLGMSELRQQALDSKSAFNYDTEVEGLRVLDKYTWQIKLRVPDPRFVNNLADPVAAGMAREVVEAYGDRIMAHPVGTAAWMLKRDEWRRSSLIVLVKNPNFRDERYAEEPPASRPDLQAVAAQLRGRKLPLPDRVEISIIEESQPRWLAFLNAEADVVVEVPADFAGIAMPNNQLAPNLAQRSVRMNRYPAADVAMSFFNMNDPMVGGTSAAQVALRRAIALGVDLDKEIRLVRKGQMIPAQGLMPPETYGYDPTFKSEMSQFDRARAKSLLDVYGFVDRNGDGWRDRPDGSELRLVYNTQPDSQYRALSELWQKNMDALKIRIEFRLAKFPENLKASRSGRLMMWGVGWVATTPDAAYHLALGYGPNAGGANHARFNLPAFNALFELQGRLPNGTERLAVMQQANKLAVAYMPYKIHGHRILTDMSHPWVRGAQRNIFRRDFWQYVDVDMNARTAAR